MAESLMGLQARLLALRGDVKDARNQGVLQEDAANAILGNLGQAQYSLNQMVVRFGESNAKMPFDTSKPLLPEFQSWPNQRESCPKCMESRPGKQSYLAASSEFPVERMKHSCPCGYAIYTKTADNSFDYDDDGRPSESGRGE